jgi:spermidine synthase
MSITRRRYHESLVHPAMMLASMPGGPKRVLLLGAGDGFAARELLKWESVTDIHLVPAAAP